MTSEFCLQLVPTCKSPSSDHAPENPVQKRSFEENQSCTQVATVPRDIATSSTTRLSALEHKFDAMQSRLDDLTKCQTNSASMMSVVVNQLKDISNVLQSLPMLKSPSSSPLKLDAPPVDPMVESLDVPEAEPSRAHTSPDPKKHASGLKGASDRKSPPREGAS